MIISQGENRDKFPKWKNISLLVNFFSKFLLKKIKKAEKLFIRKKNSYSTLFI